MKLPNEAVKWECEMEMPDGNVKQDAKSNSKQVRREIPNEVADRKDRTGRNEGVLWNKTVELSLFSSIFDKSRLSKRASCYRL